MYSIHLNPLLFKKYITYVRSLKHFVFVFSCLCIYYLLVVITFSKKNSRANTRECKQLPSIRRLFQNTVNVPDKFALGGFNSLRQFNSTSIQSFSQSHQDVVYEDERVGRCTKKNLSDTEVTILNKLRYSFMAK